MFRYGSGAISGETAGIVKICDVCHIYDNSGNEPFRILKKRKEEIYFDECPDWYLEDIKALTGIDNMIKRKLN